MEKKSNRWITGVIDNLTAMNEHTPKVTRPNNELGVTTYEFENGAKIDAWEVGEHNAFWKVMFYDKDQSQVAYFRGLNDIIKEAKVESPNIELENWEKTPLAYITGVYSEILGNK